MSQLVHSNNQWTNWFEFAGILVLSLLVTEVLGIIMVGTGVLMSQLLLEYVLDTTQDLDKRMWVYEPCLHSYDESCHVTCPNRCQQHSLVPISFDTIDSELIHLISFDQSYVPKYHNHV